MPQPIRIMSTLAVLGLLRETLPNSATATEVEYNPTARLLARIAEGERADIAILTEAAIEALTAQGVLAAGTRRDLAFSWIGLAVPAGAPHPPIGTVEDLRATLLATPTLAYSRAGASGIFFADLIQQLL